MSTRSIEPYYPSPLAFHPYDPAFPEVFALIKQLLQANWPLLQVEHIGSTSIPGMGGKNVLNCVVAVPLSDFSQTLTELESIGFHEHPFKRDPEDRPLRVGVIEYKGKKYGIHLHLLESDSQNYQNSLFFRDHLRSHPELQQKYTQLKRQAVANSSDPEEYNQAKQPFIVEVLRHREAS